MSCFLTLSSRSRRRSAADATVSPLTAAPGSGVGYRKNRSSSGLFAGTALRTPSAVQAARSIISQNSVNDHCQRRPLSTGAPPLLHILLKQTLPLTRSERSIGMDRAEATVLGCHLASIASSCVRSSLCVVSCVACRRQYPHSQGSCCGIRRSIRS